MRLPERKTRNQWKSKAGRGGKQLEPHQAFSPVASHFCMINANHVSKGNLSTVSEAVNCAVISFQIRYYPLIILCIYQSLKFKTLIRPSLPDVTSSHGWKCPFVEGVFSRGPLSVVMLPEEPCDRLRHSEVPKVVSISLSGLVVKV